MGTAVTVEAHPPGGQRAKTFRTSSFLTAFIAGYVPPLAPPILNLATKTTARAAESI
jgi:hypothetical protein